MRIPLVLLALLLISPAHAGECLLGVISVTDGGIVSNASTGYGATPGCADQTNGCAGACPKAFPIGAPMLLSIQCRTAAIVGVNSPLVDAGNGVVVATDQFFSTSTSSQRVTVSLPDGGTYTGGVVSITPPSGATATCAVWQRKGDE